MPKKKFIDKPQISPDAVRNEQRNVLVNNLSEAILGFNPGSTGTELQQVDTLQINLRYYLISNFRQLLSQAYVEKGLLQTAVDVPVDDALRGGIEIKTKQIDPEQIEALNAKMEEENDLARIGQGTKWTRLFGGGGVLIITDQDPKTPLDINAITEKTPLEFRPVDMWELFWSKQNTSDYAAAIDDQDLADVDYYDYYGHQVHKSRVRKMKGKEAPSFVRPRLRGWGLSIAESVIDALNQYLKAQNLIFEVLDEFKVDYYKIKNLANTLLSANGTIAVQKRVKLANQQKNYQHAVTMDAEDDFIQKELSFTGIAETMVGIRMAIASALRMPLTKIFGISAAGFSSGEDDIENYNAMVESEIRQKIKHDIVFCVKLRCQQMYGIAPDDLTIDFKPLRILSSEQEQNVKTQKFNRLFSAVSGGFMTVEEFKNACNKENIFGVQLDPSIDKLETGADDEEKPKDDNKSAPKSTTQAPEAKT